MTDRIIHAGDTLLDAWLNLSSTLWNTRLVSSLTYNEAHVMGILLRHSTDNQPLTATDLIRRTRLLKSQMNKLLTTLERQGFITRVRANEDKRLIHIHLTPEGEKAYREEHAGVEAILSQLIARIGVDRAHTVAKDLCVITDALDGILPEPNTSA